MSSKDKEAWSSRELSFSLVERAHQELNISVSEEKSKILRSSFKHLDLKLFLLHHFPTG